MVKPLSKVEPAPKALSQATTFENRKAEAIAYQRTLTIPEQDQQRVTGPLKTLSPYPIEEEDERRLDELQTVFDRGLFPEHRNRILLCGVFAEHLKYNQREFIDMNLLGKTMNDLDMGSRYMATMCTGVAGNPVSGGRYLSDRDLFELMEVVCKHSVWSAYRAAFPDGGGVSIDSKREQ